MDETEGNPGKRKPDDKDEYRVVNALREALHTRRHAEILFDMVVDHLGEAAWVPTIMFTNAALSR